MNNGTLLAVLTGFVISLFNLYLNNKKTNHSNLDDENDRLSKRNRQLVLKIEKLEKVESDLRNENLKLQEKILRLNAKNSDLEEVLKIKKGNSK